MTWTLNVSDCLDPVAGLASLANLSVDHTITDPPYDDEAHTLQRRVKRRRPGEPGGDNYRGRVEAAPLDFAPLTAKERRDVSVQIARVTRAWAVVFCQGEAIAAWRKDLERAGMVYRRWVPWVKPNAQPSLHGRWPGQAAEAIVLAQQLGAPPCPGGGKAIWFNHSAQNGSTANPHPTTKPLALMERLVELVSAPGELILDPYAGSGTTGVAAIKLGRAFIGWEKKPEYAATAEARLAETREQGVLPLAKQPRAKQVALALDPVT